MKENKSTKSMNNKFLVAVTVIIAIIIGIVSFQEKVNVGAGKEPQSETSEIGDYEKNVEVENATNETDTAESNDIIIGGQALSGLSESEKVAKCSELVFSKEFVINGKTYKANEVAVENLENDYVFFKVVDVSDETINELMLVNLSGDIESNLALSFLSSYYYLYYFTLNGTHLDTEFAPIDVQTMGNTIALTNENVEYDFKYSYEIDGNSYIFTEVE